MGLTQLILKLCGVLGIMTTVKTKLTVSALDHVQTWLDKDAPQSGRCSPEQTQAYINKVTSDMGYGFPFDREQKALNAYLIKKGADLLALCFTAWGLYHDLKLRPTSN